MSKFKLFSAILATVTLPALLTFSTAGASGEVVPHLAKAHLTPSSLTVNWTVPPYGAGISGGFQVRADALDGSGTSTEWIGMRSYERSWTFTGLSSGTTYRIYVDDLVGNRQISGVPTTIFGGKVNALVMTRLYTTPGKKTTLGPMRITSLVPSSGSLAVSWAAPKNTASNPVRYYQISATPVGVNMPGATQWYNLPPSARSYTLTGLTSNQDYVFYYNTVYRNGFLRTQGTTPFHTL